MAANTSQIFSSVADVQWVNTGGTANTTMDLTSGTISLIFTADATNGGRIERVNIIHAGTNAGSLLRFFINNGSTTGTATNNSLIEEVVMAANTLSQTAISVPNYMIRVPIVMPPGYRLYCTVATAVAAGYLVTAFGGKF